ncbi:transglycosylase SLT domain-containing protein [Candidatus Woesearchaeota archaeon]|nr:transglycosylase SLT domain-containing protein [Candidatus Woesearchaeota archaeon]
MIIGKKGEQTAIIVTLVFMLSLTMISYLLIDKEVKFDKVSKGKTVGERQFELFAMYAEGEKAMYYAEEAARLSAGMALAEIERNGGYSGKSPCGSFEGFNMWKNGEKECFPSSKDAKKGLETAISRKLKHYYLNYMEAEMPSEYRYSFADSDIYISSSKPMALQGNGKKDSIYYSIIPSFRIAIQNDFSPYDDIAAKAKSLTEECLRNDDFEECMMESNNQKAGNAILEVGCGQHPESSKPVKICAKKGNEEIRFAISKEPIPIAISEIEVIKQISEKQGVPKEAALKIAAIESGFTFQHTDSKGNVKKGDNGCSTGIMQINTCAHKQCIGTIKYDPSSSQICTGTESCSGKTIDDMECNIEAGIMYLKAGYLEYEQKEKQGRIDNEECYSCKGKYKKWDYAFRYYNGCKCTDNNYVEKARKADVSEYLN